MQPLNIFPTIRSIRRPRGDMKNVRKTKREGNFWLKKISILIRNFFEFGGKEVIRYVREMKKCVFK